MNKYDALPMFAVVFSIGLCGGCSGESGDIPHQITANLDESTESASNSLREAARLFCSRFERVQTEEEIARVKNLAKEQVAEWFQASADGDPDGQYLAAVVLEIGMCGVGRDEAKSLRLMRRAADAGQPHASFELGYNLKTNATVESDAQEAFSYLLFAAKKKVTVAQHEVALCYRHGKGVAPDDNSAVHWYRQAASQGHAASLYNLGCALQRGRGVEQNDAEAVTVFALAANQGLKEAQYNLGVCYRDGTGCERQPEKAVGYFRLAAAQGMADACNNLVVCYRDGVGVPKDSNRATYWNYRADGISHESAFYETYERPRLAAQELDKMKKRWREEDRLLDEWAEREANERAYPGN